MKFFTKLLNQLASIQTSEQKKANSSSSLESKQTGSCGGMSSTELKIRLELILGDLHSNIPIIEPAIELAKLSHPTQSNFLDQLTLVADLSSKHAYLLLTASSSALKSMEQDQCQQWLDDIKAKLQDHENDAATVLINNHSQYSRENTAHDHIVHLKSITEKLTKIVISIHKSPIPIVPQDLGELIAYTDTQQIYLPSTISYFDNASDNYTIYKVKLFHLLAQIHCHTWDITTDLRQGIKKHKDPFLHLFSTIETLRLNQIIKQEFPGIWREINYLHKITHTDEPEHLFESNDPTTSQTSLRICYDLIEKKHSLTHPIYQTSFFPDKIVDARQIQPDQELLIMTQLDQEQSSQEETTKSGRVFLRKEVSSKEQQNNTLGETGHSLWEQLPQRNEAGSEEQAKLAINPQETNVFYYPEWDTSIQKYRDQWCRVKEIVVKNTSQDLKGEMPESMKYAELRIKKILDLLINEQKSVRYQTDGDEIDIDAWVAARSNIKKQTDDYQQLYIRNNKKKRDIAIMFAVDISGSTSGWKTTAIKQATELLCKVLTSLGDQYAVYAFSGSGRKSCRIYPIKFFSEAYNKIVKQRILSMQPQQYTRMGASIRHLSKVLSNTSAKTKILFILTDGKPDDIDSYRGNYGIEDTRRAIQESKALALNPFVLTFDKEGLDYLPHMLGSNSYQLITDISELPVQISTIYKHLTA